MAEVERDPACVERWPGAASGEFDPRCCRFPKSCSADLPEVDPEVERLARVCADADAGSPQPHPIDNDRRIVAAVLGDLRERYILVPRDGTEVYQQWANSRRADGPGPDARPAVDEEHADSLRSQWNHLHATVAASKGEEPRPPLRKYVRLTVHTRWEPSP